MREAHSKMTHIKQQKYFHYLKGCFICVILLWASHIVIKQQFFLHVLHKIADKTLLSNVSTKESNNSMPDAVIEYHKIETVDSAYVFKQHPHKQLGLLSRSEDDRFGSRKLCTLYLLS